MYQLPILSTSMKIRLLAFLMNASSSPKVKHLYGLPPELTEGKDMRQEMGSASFLLIEEGTEGVFLYRFTDKGDCVGYTWNASIDDARHQSDYEYEGALQEWQEVPSDIEDAVAFGVTRGVELRCSPTSSHSKVEA